MGVDSPNPAHRCATRAMLLLALLAPVGADGRDLASYFGSAPARTSVDAALGLEELFPPAVVEQSLVDRPDLAETLLATLADALGRADDGLVDRLASYAVAIARERSWRLSDRRAEDWPDDEILGLVSLQLLDAPRFGRDPGFRARVVTRLPDGLDPTVSPALRSRVLGALAAAPGIDFRTFEDLAYAWKALARTSSGRLAPGGRPSVLDGPGIDASMFVLPSSLFGDDEVLRFLAAVNDAAPDRNLIVLTDGPLLRRLAPHARAMNVDLIDTFGTPFSPWPRDPLTLALSPSGGVHVLLRPNAQPRRELDALIGLALIDGLPDTLDRMWGPLTWSTASVPFHNGQVLLTPKRAWISIHTQEERILELQGLDRVPAARFDDPDTVARYVDAARRAAGELEEVYGRPIAFVHPLPSPGPDAASLMRRLGGGAGYDLDSLVTLLPDLSGALSALVGDLEAGRKLLAGASDEELAALADVYGLEEDGLRGALEAAQTTPRAEALQGFLDLVARYLEAETRVLRLPLLQVPLSLRREPSPSLGAEFLLTWNNVVLEQRSGELLAEGFAGHFAPGDRAAEAVFAAAGYRLRLLPALVQSVLRNGGYRCASQHFRLGRGS